jgi:hypothetical protein
MNIVAQTDGGRDGRHVDGMRAEQGEERGQDAGTPSASVTGGS